MFGFGKKKKEEKKKSKIDKLIMGAIVGGAVGSVIGMSIAPKKGKETREYIAQKGKELFQKGQEVTEKISEKVADRKLEKAMDGKKKEPRKKFFSRMKDRLFGKKKAENKVLDAEDLFKKIPNEVE